jgi:hypothetical protein
MQPFNQTESDMTKTALTLSPASEQMYNAPIQQNIVRKKTSQSLIINNFDIIKLSTGVI